MTTPAPSTNRCSIAGVEIRPLRVVRDDRGAVLQVLRCDAPHFRRFGEVYFSLVNPGAVKAWHRHHRSIVNYAVPLGQVKLAMYDDRRRSLTAGAVAELVIGIENYCLVTIPPFVWSGFVSVAATPSLVANCSTWPHTDEDVDRLSSDDPSVPYRWADDPADERHRCK